MFLTGTIGTIYSSEHCILFDLCKANVFLVTQIIDLDVKKSKGW